MKELKIPSDYQQVMPYLIVKDAAGFMKFMQDVFDAKEKMKQMRDENIIMHAEITVGESVIMFADSTEAFLPRTGGFFIMYLMLIQLTIRPLLQAPHQYARVQPALWQEWWYYRSLWKYMVAYNAIIRFVNF